MSFHKSYINSKNVEIDLLVLVWTRPNLRGSLTEMTMYRGKHILDNLFDNLLVDSVTKNIYIEYPERWTNIIEQRAILSRIPILYPNIETVEIKTHSVYIIQCTHSGQARICDMAGEYPERDYKDLTVRFSPVPDELVGLWKSDDGGPLNQLTKSDL